MGQASTQRVLLSTADDFPGLDYTLLKIPKEEGDRADKYATARELADKGRNELCATNVIAITARNANLPGCFVAMLHFFIGGA